jgi:hypothetical protein
MGKERLEKLSVSSSNFLGGFLPTGSQRAKVYGSSFDLNFVLFLAFV